MRAIPCELVLHPSYRWGRRNGLKTSPVLPPPAAWVLVLLFGISAWVAFATVVTVATASAVLAVSEAVASGAVDDISAYLAVMTALVATSAGDVAKAALASANVTVVDSELLLLLLLLLGHDRRT